MLGSVMQWRPAAQPSVWVVDCRAFVLLSGEAAIDAALATMVALLEEELIIVCWPLWGEIAVGGAKAAVDGTEEEGNAEPPLNTDG